MHRVKTRMAHPSPTTDLHFSKCQQSLSHHSTVTPSSQTTSHHAASADERFLETAWQIPAASLCTNCPSIWETAGFQFASPPLVLLLHPPRHLFLLFPFPPLWDRVLSLPPQTESLPPNLMCRFKKLWLRSSLPCAESYYLLPTCLSTSSRKCCLWLFFIVIIFKCHSVSRASILSADVSLNWK